MTPAFRRTAGRLAVAALATTALAGAAITGGQAATTSTSCDTSAIVKTVDLVLSVRDGLTQEPDTCH
ncbi:hypothetical protein E0H75_18730 [Kribbella capetownensis]|uniref:Uncharacterized protein n=1 Tax=Kribbella capetownensis TaxID=1572659 RepID=A0A4R0JTZ6_9ACTN|nr:hypothetical protein [Kribbella capetownensis]TCC48626.1 hypothetical protein E0H75_18730 [Kribbella capetownensis]